jgi:hypothetical protein
MVLKGVIEVTGQLGVLPVKFVNQELWILPEDFSNLTLAGSQALSDSTP